MMQLPATVPKDPPLLDHVVKPDLVAPGNLIISVLGDGTLHHLFPLNITDKNYFISERYQHGGSHGERCCSLADCSRPRLLRRIR